MNPYFKPYLGGIERIIERVGEQLLVSPGVEAVGVLTTHLAFPGTPMPGLPEHEILDGLEVFRGNFRPASIRPFFHAAGAGYFSWDVSGVLSRFQPDIIHFTYSEWWGANLGIYLSSRGKRHVLSTFFHDLPRNPRTFPLYASNRWLVQRMDAIHVLTDRERDQVEAAYGAPPGRIAVIPPGLDGTSSERAPRGRGPVTVLAVGRLSHHKGQLRLLQMFHRILRGKPGLDARLWLVGDPGDAHEAIIQYVKEHHLDDLVQLFGHCSDERLAQIYRSADIFALPTGYESFGLVFIEAMWRGVPVVTYAVGPVPSVLTEGASLVPQGNERVFQQELEALMLSPDLRKDLGRAGLRLVDARYSWEATGAQFLALYHQITALPAASSRVTA